MGPAGAPASAIQSVISYRDSQQALLNNLIKEAAAPTVVLHAPAVSTPVPTAVAPATPAKVDVIQTAAPVVTAPAPAPKPTASAPAGQIDTSKLMTVTAPETEYNYTGMYIGIAAIAAIIVAVTIAYKRWN